MIRGSVKSFAQAGGQGSPAEHAGLGHEPGRADEPQGDVAGLERERQHQQQQPDRGPDEPMADAASRMPALFSSSFSAAPGGSVATTTLGSMRGEAGADGEHDGGQAHGELRTEGVAAELEQDAARDGGHHGGHPAEQAELRVGLDQSPGRSATVVGTTAAREIR
jgi:hypothetical protein